MVNAFNYSNTAVQTALTGNISNVALSFTVGATTGFPGTTPYVLALDYGAATEELVVVTNVAGTTLTVTRGFSGTSAQSHSLGAVVRHVVNAQDLTDFRTHEAATASVHGVTGALVGATTVQTLTNKTLSAPTITAPTVTGGGSLAGTFTGAPTLSGNVTFTGAPVFNTSSGVQFQRATGPSVAWKAQATGDANQRIQMLVDGTLQWGDGTAAQDVNLYRFAANTLGTDDAFRAVGQLIAVPTNTAVDGLDVNLPTGTTGDLLNLRVNSNIQAAMDSSGQYRVYGGNSPTSYTPTVSNGGTVTWTDRTGYWWRLGKIVFVNIFLTVNNAGSGSGIVQVTMPSSVDRSTRQALTLNVESIGANGNATSASRGGECVFFVSGSGSTADRLRVDNTTEQNILGNDLLAGGTLTIQGWYREA
jgi:hypothetical protein